jgi:hypothetical protein
VKLTLIAQILQVGIENPTLALPYRLWFRRLECFDLDKVYEQVLQTLSCNDPGQVRFTIGADILEIKIKKRVNQRFGQPFAFCNAFIDKECIEMAAFA